jgi:hypothetical protein
MLSRGLGAQVSPALCDALLAAAQVEAEAAASAPPGTLPPGMSAARAAQLEALVPRVAPLRGDALRGPHDRWEGPPDGVR